MQKIYPIKIYFPKYTKIAKNSTIRPSKPIKKWAKDLNRHLTKEDRLIANKQMKRYSTPHIIREKLIKRTARYHHTPIRKAKIKNLTPPRPARMWGSRNAPSLLTGVQNGAATLEGSFW